MAEEFKISRLIFTWVGEWSSTTVYKRDDITQYEGKSYVCIEPHLLLTFMMILTFLYFHVGS